MVGRVDLSVEVGGLRLRNPLVLASGFLDESAASMKRVWDAGAGAVVTKSIGMKPRAGHPNPGLVEVEGGFVNALGLPNPGIEAFTSEVEETVAHGATTIGSVFGGDEQEFAHLAGAMQDAGAHALELNVSCPHAQGYGTEIGCDPVLLGRVVAAARSATQLPLFVKLSPNVADVAAMGGVAVQAGATGLTCVNTLKAMAMDADARRPVLGNEHGGLSGRALKPVALRAVWDVHRKGLGVPIMGVGGIETGRDAIEFLLAGASAVQLGSVLIKDDLAAFGRIGDEIDAWCGENDVSRWTELIGTALSRRSPPGSEA